MGGFLLCVTCIKLHRLEFVVFFSFCLTTRSENDKRCFLTRKQLCSYIHFIYTQSVYKIHISGITFKSLAIPQMYTTKEMNNNFFTRGLLEDLKKKKRQRNLQTAFVATILYSYTFIPSITSIDIKYILES